MRLSELFKLHVQTHKAYKQLHQQIQNVKYIFTYGERKENPELAKYFYETDSKNANSVDFLYDD